MRDWRSEERAMASGSTAAPPKRMVVFCRLKKTKSRKQAAAMLLGKGNDALFIRTRDL